MQLVGHDETHVSLSSIVEALAEYYGEPSPPPERTLFEWLVRENIAYLADDAHRDAAFARLGGLVPITPSGISMASPDVLRSATQAGILAANQAEKLRHTAEL